MWIARTLKVLAYATLFTLAAAGGAALTGAVLLASGTLDVSDVALAVAWLQQSWSSVLAWVGAGASGVGARYALPALARWCWSRVVEAIHAEVARLKVKE